MTAILIESEMPGSAESCRALKVTEWRTPLSAAKLVQVGNARLHRSVITPGHYFMEGVRGYLFYVLEQPVTQTSLQRRDGRDGEWETWMVDEPLHWYAMKEMCERLPAGRVLCAGLGLGLMVHHLAARGDITEIRVVEESEDVIDLIRPTLPARVNCRITHDNFYGFLKDGGAAGYDSILWDLAVGEEDETAGDFMLAQVMANVFAPGVPLFRFGLSDSTDPAVLFTRALLRERFARERS